LILLANHCGCNCIESIHVLEKAIVLLKWGVEISCEDTHGNTVLHTILERSRAKPITLIKERNRVRKEPGELLKVFIAAGADVYALNKAGFSASKMLGSVGERKNGHKHSNFVDLIRRRLWNKPCEYMGNTLGRVRPPNFLSRNIIESGMRRSGKKG
jgi:hypothetical protein